MKKIKEKWLRVALSNVTLSCYINKTWILIAILGLYRAYKSKDGEILLFKLETLRRAYKWNIINAIKRWLI